MIVRYLYASSLLFLLSTAAYPDLLLPRNATWQYLKGTAEASAPVDAWRLTGFDDSSWNTGSTPIRYGDGVGGTILDDMRGNYTSVFMRRSFNVPDLAQVARLNLNVDWDDGYLLWINGVLVDSRNPRTLRPMTTPLEEVMSPAPIRPLPFQTRRTISGLE